MARTARFGFLVAALGVGHFVAPKQFASIVKPVFPADTDAWVLRNGVMESAIGTSMMVPKLRKLGVVGLLGYIGWLGYRAVDPQG